MLDRKEMTLKLREYKEFKRMSEEIKNEMLLIEESIKNEMTEQKVDQLTIGEYKIKWTTVVTNRIDSKKLKQDHEELYSAYSKDSISKRFSVV